MGVWTFLFKNFVKYDDDQIKKLKHTPNGRLFRLFLNELPPGFHWLFVMVLLLLGMTLQICGIVGGALPRIGCLIVAYALFVFSNHYMLSDDVYEEIDNKRDNSVEIAKRTVHGKKDEHTNIEFLTDQFTRAEEERGRAYSKVKVMRSTGVLIALLGTLVWGFGDLIPYRVMGL